MCPPLHLHKEVGKGIHQTGFRIEHHDSLSYWVNTALDRLQEELKFTAVGLTL